MKRYFLYDNVLQSEKAPSIAVATRALFDFLNLTIPRLKEAKADLGSEMMALDKKQFINTIWWDYDIDILKRMINIIEVHENLD